MISVRPLTADDIAQRRELLKQKQVEHTATGAESTSSTVEHASTTNENGADNPAKTENDENVFLAFARVFSGRLKRGQKIFVLSPRHDPSLFVGKVKERIVSHENEPRLLPLGFK